MKSSKNLVKDKYLKTLVFILCYGLSYISVAQDLVIDSSVSETHNRKRAAIWSTCLPGSGQIYNEFGYRKYADKKNRAWWKVPIIYGGLGVTGYYFYDNMTNASKLKKEILYRRDNPGMNLYAELSVYSNESELINGFDDFSTGTKVYRKGFDECSVNRDLFVFGIAGIWIIQVIEAYVDAHFVTFDVSDKLSFNFTPRYYNYTESFGLGMSLNIY